jgi:hypothetical protein
MTHRGGGREAPFISRKCGAFLRCCISYFSHCCDQIPDRNNLREEGFILALGFRGIILSWRGGCGRAEQFKSWQPESRERAIQEEARTGYNYQDIPSVTCFFKSPHLLFTISPKCCHDMDPLSDGSIY